MKRNNLFSLITMLFVLSFVFSGCQNREDAKLLIQHPEEIAAVQLMVPSSGEKYTMKQTDHRSDVRDMIDYINQAKKVDDKEQYDGNPISGKLILIYENNDRKTLTYSEDIIKFDGEFYEVENLRDYLSDLYHNIGEEAVLADENGGIIVEVEAVEDSEPATTNPVQETPAANAGDSAITPPKIETQPVEPVLPVTPAKKYFNHTLENIEIYVADETALNYNLDTQDSKDFMALLPLSQFVRQEKTIELSTIDMSSGSFVRINSEDMDELAIFKNVDQAKFTDRNGSVEYYSIPNGTYNVAISLAETFKEKGTNVTFNE